jgi:hypothetical protein
MATGRASRIPAGRWWKAKLTAFEKWWKECADYEAGE